MSATVILPCSARKAVPPTDAMRAATLPFGSQAAVRAAWGERVAAADPVLPARDLYRGRGFGLGLEAARSLEADILVISAGLGLVPGDRMVPSYGLTVAGGSPDSLRPRIDGWLDRGSWWMSLYHGAFGASPIWGMIQAKGLLLMPLSRPYAELVAPVLNRLGPDTLDRLRIFGWRLEDVLPDRGMRCIMPYDRRLDRLHPGIALDWPQRALAHFVREVLPQAPGDDLRAGREQARLVREAMDRAATRIEELAP